MDFSVLAQECAPWVAHETMAAIVKTESAFRPLAIGVNGKSQLSRQPETKAEAVVTAKWLIANGYNIDMGLGQVNSANLPKLGLSVEDVFEPCKNLAAAATILHGNYQVARGKVQGEQGALLAAVSAYNTGSFSKGFSNGYVQKVINNAGAVTPGVTVQAEAPKPPLIAKALKPAAKVRAQPVKLTVQRAEVAPASVDVYGASNKNIMVY